MAGVLSEAFLKERSEGKILFKQGKIQESFQYLESKVLKPSRERLQNGEVNAIFEVLDTLILIGRLRMEIGQYP